MRRTHLRRWSGGVAAIVLVAGLAACSDNATPAQYSPTSSAIPTSQLSLGAPTGDEPTDEPTKEPRNDLRKLPLKRTLNAGPLRVKVKYDSGLKLKRWYPDRSKPLRINLTAVNRNKPKQKIYLTRATANITAYDDQGQIGDAQSVKDSADVSPGYIVTSPNSYNESLSIPPLDSGSLWMTIDLSYEFVMEVDRTKEGRDFAKQVATDTITVPLAR